MAILLPLTYTESDRLLSSSDGLVGARLAGVTYRYLPYDGEDEYDGGEATADTDLNAVVFDLGPRGLRTFTWATPYVAEGISVLGEGEPYPSSIDGSVDAATRPGWRAHVGRSILGVEPLWQPQEDDSLDDALWAVTVTFPTGWILIALGEYGDALRYSADELVAVFDPATASAYLAEYSLG